MNFSLKCLHCKCRKWFKWGKFCRQCLKENDECIAGDFEINIGGIPAGKSKYYIINQEGNYVDVRKPIEGIEDEIK